jgi:hypothetical protein
MELQENLVLGLEKVKIALITLSKYKDQLWEESFLIQPI